MHGCQSQSQQRHTYQGTCQGTFPQPPLQAASPPRRLPPPPPPWPLPRPPPSPLLPLLLPALLPRRLPLPRPSPRPWRPPPPPPRHPPAPPPQTSLCAAPAQQRPPAGWRRRSRGGARAGGRGTAARIWGVAEMGTGLLTSARESQLANCGAEEERGEKETGEEGGEGELRKNKELLGGGRSGWAERGGVGGGSGGMEELGNGEQGRDWGAGEGMGSRGGNGEQAREGDACALPSVTPPPPATACAHETGPAGGNAAGATLLAKGG
ncbi:unnamed protein product [Closterium sp. NIES-54]